MRNLYKRSSVLFSRFCCVVVLCTLIMSTSASIAYGQAGSQQIKKRITGTVVDASGAPLIGATVNIRNTSIGTATNTDGLFVIDVKNDDVLRISYIGFLSKDIQVGGKSTLNIKLEQDPKMLEEVVVVGYGKQKRAAMVSSISSVSAKELIAPTSNITANLAGQFAGLISVQRSAEPGRDDAEFWIRGMSSFAGGTKPLVLVDGIPRDINNIEADEIDSFSVLKDAAATAVYGAEGANGVILVTTKRGTISKPKISFRAEYSVAQPQRVPEFVDSWTYLDLANEALANDGLDPYMSAENIAKYRNRVDNDLYPNTKWMDELLDDAVQNQRYTLNFRGGAENAKYFVSAAYFNQGGVFKDNPMGKYDSDFKYQRYNLRANVDLKVSKTTSVNVDISGQYVHRLTSNRSPDDIFKYMLFTPPHLFPTIYSDGTLATYSEQSDGNSRNPYNMLYNQGYRKENGTRIQSNVGVNQDLHFITTGLSANAKVSFDYDATASTLRNYGPSLYNATGRDGDGYLVYNTVFSGSSEMADPEFTGNDYKRKIYIEGSLNYARTFGRHEVGAMALYMQKENQIYIPKYDNTTADSRVKLPIRKQGLVGRFSYSYDQRYYIEASFGYTGSYQFATGNRFGFFPAVGLSYFISNEKFYPDALKKVLSTAKIRVSVGRTGNDEVMEDGDLVQFIFRPTFNTSGHTFNQGIGSNGATNGLGAGIRDMRPANYALQWEEELKRNIGVDLGFFDNSIEITADYFNNRRSNILVQRRTIPGVAGFHEQAYQNYGIVDNWGIDASLAAHRTFGKVKVSARGTFTFARNKIIEYDEIPPLYDYQAITGRRIKEQNVYIAERLYTADDFISSQNPNGTYSYTLKPGLPSVGLNGTLGPGDIKYKDINHDGIIDTDDKVRGIGHPYNPEINYGFGVNVEWKGFYISAFFQGVGNSSILMNQSSQTYVATTPFSWGVGKANYRTAFLNRWTAANQGANVVMPRIHSHYSYDVNKEPNTWWLKSGNFLRFKNMEIGYTLPERITKKIKIDNFRIYVLGHNLFVWDDLGLWDPELGQRNVAGMSYPMSRTFTAGIEFNF